MGVVRGVAAGLTLAACLGFAGALAGGKDDGGKNVPSEDLKAGGDVHKRYFLIGPKKGGRAPNGGYGLVVVLPGGPGTADFHPFVKRLYQQAVPDGFLAAQPVAVKWTADQQVVWPTETSRVEQMKFGTEAFVEAVIRDVGKRHKLDARRVYTLSWSSSGPAAYALSLKQKTPVAGSFVAMSVFVPARLPDLKGAKGHAYFLYHSPDDRVCPFRMAKDAEKRLADHGAAVTLQTYKGGHGWRGDVFGDVRRGLQWLEARRAGRAD